MKAGMNGVPRCEHPDGWWAEAAGRGAGWAAGGDAEAPDADARRHAGLRLLRRRSCRFTTRAIRERHPREWLQVVRQTIRTVTPAFSARRMMKEYVELMYIPAALGAIASSKG
jgi:starch phosphorylase